MRYFLILIFALNLFRSYAQDAPVNGWDLREKIEKKDIKDARNKFLKSLQAEHSKHYNVPQGDWYIGARAGYGIPFLTVNRRSIESYLGVSDYFENAAGEISDKTVVTTDAAGFRSAFFFGHRINPYLAVEMDVAFTSYKSTLQGRIVSPDYTSQLFTKGRDFSLSPQVVLLSPEVGNFTFYGKFGFHFPAYASANADAKIEDYNGTFIKSISNNSQTNLFGILDLVAEALGENVGGLGFLEDGFFNAIGYRFNLETEGKVDFRLRPDALGYTASLGVIYQISPLVSIMGEIRNGGYNITTKSYELSNVNGTMDLLGIRDYLVFTDEGVVVQGNEFIPAEELQWLYKVNYHYALDEESNNERTNPNGLDYTKPSDRLGLRRSTYATSFNVCVQFNLRGKKQ